MTGLAMDRPAATVEPRMACLPDGFRVRLAPTTRRLDDGRVLLGGSPLALVRLTQRARSLLVDDGDGTHLDVRDASTADLADRLLARNLAQPLLADLPTPAPDQLTVVIPVRDRAAQLDRCLAALGGLDCVVVDDASQDPAAVAVVAAAHGARLIALSDNRGPAGARNAGLATVSTPYVALVDSDVEIAGDQLLALCRHFADPTVAVVGPRVAGVVRSRRPRWFQRYDAAHSSLDQGRDPVTVAHGASIAWLPSACLVARTRALGGGFDQEMRVGEDVDLVWRLLAAGHRVRYAPETVAHHETRGTLTAWLGRITAYGTSGGPLAARHGDVVAPAAFTPLFGVTGFAVLTRCPVAVPLLATTAILTFRRLRPGLPDGWEGHRETARLTALGLSSAIRQATALTVRHWWPLALLGLTTRAGRRIGTSALMIDAVVALRDRPDGSAYAETLAGRRLSDLAYGTGLWRGALRARSIRCLLPRRIPSKRH